jgi:hypothetical protein
MPTYTVHEPQPPAVDVDDRAMSLVFVKEGFAWLGFIAPFLWLLYHRLWRDVFLFVVIAIMLMVAVSMAGGNTTALAWTGLLINLAFASEARNLYRAALSRRGYALIGVVTGRDLEDAERRFLSEWLPGSVTNAGNVARGPLGEVVADASQTSGAIPFMGAGMAHG